MKNTKLDLCQAAVLGAAIGDAMGVPYEFLGRDEVRDVYCSEMIGNDTDSGISSRWGRLIPAGCWSDDTSMLIASMDAIAKEFSLLFEKAAGILPIQVGRKIGQCIMDDFRERFATVTVILHFFRAHVRIFGIKRKMQMNQISLFGTGKMCVIRIVV